MSDLEPYLDALRETTEPSRATVARLRQAAPRRRWGGALRWGLAVAVAAIAWLAMRAGTPPVPEPAVAPLAPMELGRDASPVALGPHVSVTADGRGSAEGNTDHLRVRWMAGAATFEVAPGRGVELEVSTPEARIWVTGTRFEVRRDALGTHVAVTEGAIAVACGSDPRRALGPGQATDCRPVDAAGWLRRVTALHEAEDHRGVVDGVGAALALDPPDPIRLELRLQRVWAAIALGELEQASAELDALGGDHPEATARIEAARRALRER